MRLVYFGTPDDAVPPLRALVAAGHDVALVVTQPDRRRGKRGNELLPSPVKACATELGLPVATPQRSAEIVDEVTALGADLGVVVAFGQLLPPALLAATAHGFVNVHFSLLPRWRGAAPVERALLAGDPTTGVGIMEMEAGLDTGGLFAESRIDIRPDDTAGTLRTRLVEAGTALLVATLPSVIGRVPDPQHGEPTYASKLTVEEFRLDPRCTAAELALRVRAGNPRPGAWATIAGKRLKVLAAVETDVEAPPAGCVSRGAVLGCSPGGLQLVTVQPEGKQPMDATAWIAGRRDEVVLDD